MLLGSIVFGENSVVTWSYDPELNAFSAITYLFPSTSETQLTLGVVVRVLSPIGHGFVQPVI